MNGQNNLVSVIIPTYKRADMLPRAVDSVLNQTYKNVEVIVVDDNNPDTEWRASTTGLMQQYADNLRVRYICHEKNMNGSVARNTGIAEAKGDIITFLDDDDEYFPEKIEKEIEYLIAHPEFHCVVCGWNRDGKDVIPPSEKDLMFNLLSGYHIVYTNTIMMWANDARECGGFDVTFKRHQEASFLLRYMRMGGIVGIVREVLVKFNIEDRSNVANPEQNEIQTLHYIDTFPDLIEKCDAEKPGSKDEILLGRYRGIWVNYIKKHQFIGAFKFHLRASRRMPKKFTAGLLKYLIAKITKR